jgi:ribosomal protein S6
VKRYEGLFILNISGKEEGVKETLDKVSADITAAGGKVETVQKMDKKVLPRGGQEIHRRLLRQHHFQRHPRRGGAVAKQICAERRGLPRPLHARARAETSGK